MARWKRQGWRTVATDQHPIEAATRSLDNAIPVLTTDPTTTVQSFVESSESASGLEEMSDEQLQARTLRETNIALIVVEDAIAQHCEDLMRNKTAEFALLLQALAALRRSL